MPRCEHGLPMLPGRVDGHEVWGAVDGCVMPVESVEPRPVLPRIEARSTVKATVPVPHEHAEQVALMRQVRAHQRDHWELGLLHAVPNGGVRHKGTAARLSEEGVQAGVPDLCLPVSSSGYHGLWIELKREKGGRIAPAQQEWLDTLGWLGYRVAVCRGWREAWDVLCEYLGISEEEQG